MVAGQPELSHNGVLAEWWLGSHCFFWWPELSHNGVLAEWWLESHWVVGGGWTARVVTSLLSGGWKASGFFFGWMVAGKP